MLSTNEQREVSNSIDVIKGTCQEPKCGKSFWAPVFFTLTGEKIPTILCAECVVETMKIEGLYSKEQEEKVLYLYEAAKNKVN